MPPGSASSVRWHQLTGCQPSTARLNFKAVIYVQKAVVLEGLEELGEEEDGAEANKQPSIGDLEWNQRKSPGRLDPQEREGAWKNRQAGAGRESLRQEGEPKWEAKNVVGPRPGGRGWSPRRQQRQADTWAGSRVEVVTPYLSPPS